MCNRVYGHSGEHRKIRQEICDYMEAHEEEYALFVASDDLEPKEAFERHGKLMFHLN